jgi:drug/metabolite transporter (DMT)-like permease
VLGYFIWFYVIKQSSSVATSSFLFAEPLITVLFAAVLISEEVTPYTVMGGLLIFIGVFLITNRLNTKYNLRRT